MVNPEPRDAAKVRRACRRADCPGSTDLVPFCGPAVWLKSYRLGILRDKISIFHECRHYLDSFRIKRWFGCPNDHALEEMLCEDAVYVYICNAFTEKQVSGAIHSGVASPSGVFRHLGCVPQCGKCVPTVRCLVRNGASPTVDAKRYHDRGLSAGLQPLG